MKVGWRKLSESQRLDEMNVCASHSAVLGLIWEFIKAKNTLNES